MAMEDTTSMDLAVTTTDMEDTTTDMVDTTTGMDTTTTLDTMDITTDMDTMALTTDMADHLDSEVLMKMELIIWNKANTLSAF